MRGVVDLLEDLEAVLSALNDLDTGTLLLEDWDAGLDYRAPVDAATVQALLANARERYGCPVRFFFFDDTREVRWEGELGWRLTVGADGPYEVREQVVHLNTDTRRFPGMKPLRGLHRAEVQVFLLGNRPLHLKFKRLGGEIGG